MGFRPAHCIASNHVFPVQILLTSRRRHHGMRAKTSCSQFRLLSPCRYVAWAYNRQAVIWLFPEAGVFLPWQKHETNGDECLPSPNPVSMLMRRGVPQYWRMRAAFTVFQARCCLYARRIIRSVPFLIQLQYFQNSRLAIYTYLQQSGFMFHANWHALPNTIRANDCSTTAAGSLTPLMREKRESTIAAGLSPSATACKTTAGAQPST